MPIGSGTRGLPSLRAPLADVTVWPTAAPLAMPLPVRNGLARRVVDPCGTARGPWCPRRRLLIGSKRGLPGGHGVVTVEYGRCGMACRGPGQTRTTLGRLLAVTARRRSGVSRAVRTRKRRSRAVLMPIRTPVKHVHRQCDHHVAVHSRWSPAVCEVLGRQRQPPSPARHRTSPRQTDPRGRRRRVRPSLAVAARSQVGRSRRTLGGGATCEPPA